MPKKRSYAAQKKAKPQQKMKELEQDPCPTCLYGKKREQHNVPKRVENFNRVKPTEAFGPGAKKKNNRKAQGRKKK